jgi:hypothetical protein
VRGADRIGTAPAQAAHGQEAFGRPGRTTFDSLSPLGRDVAVCGRRRWLRPGCSARAVPTPAQKARPRLAGPGRPVATRPSRPWTRMVRPMKALALRWHVWKLLARARWVRISHRPRKLFREQHAACATMPHWLHWLTLPAFPPLATASAFASAWKARLPIDWAGRQPARAPPPGGSTGCPRAGQRKPLGGRERAPGVRRKRDRVRGVRPERTDPAQEAPPRWGILPAAERASWSRRTRR